MRFEFKGHGFCSGWSLILLLLSGAVLSQLGGCAGLPGKQVPDQVALFAAERELSDAELLDVSIKVFDPGELPDDEDEQSGLSPEIREAEARFVPIHLKYTMQRSGYWGIVRVVPDDDNGTEVLVRGKIEYSDGESGAVSVEVVDARNIVWFRKTYLETANRHEHERTEPEKKDIFQDLFNTIANDMIEYRNSLTPAEVEELKQAAELRFAATMAPDAFTGYLEEDPDGAVRIMRLPSRDDPMLDRVQAIRARDDMLVDAINGYYDAYYLDLWEPYNDWRKFRSEEVVALRKLEREALTRQVLGIAAIVGAIAIGASGDYETRAQTSTLRDVMLMGGAAGVYAGHQKSQEGKINQEAIEELGISFSSEAEPLVVDVDGETVRLTGSAEQQYARWRELLRQIYARETGLIPAAPQAPAEEQAESPQASDDE